MFAALMWTISDFSGLGNLSGWNTHSGFACPNCNMDATPRDRIRFDGKVEQRGPPKTLRGTDIMLQ
ncbi:hypothetical protein PIB30_009914 [Stylosanthes scabra]|uniref:Uncharacterized protein n=1 Tax=Stylosanthes scabra TaxID=79078 RepID=A0ABU6S5X1_9FABA|nr:hypothetical protein [Stylosanthes scabra]